MDIQRSGRGRQAGCHGFRLTQNELVCDRDQGEEGKQAAMVLG